MKRKIKVVYGVIILLAILLLFYFLPDMTQLAKYADPYQLRVFIRKFGFLAPLVLIFLQTLQASFSVLPFYGVTIASGFVFGAFWGLIYALIGSFIGSAIAFLLARKYGINVLNKFVRKKDIVKFQHFFEGREGKALLLARFLPLFPNNVVSFTAGLTKMGFKQFNIISTIGFLFQILALTYFGDALSTGTVNWTIVGMIVLLVLFAFLIITKLEKWKKLHQKMMRKP